MSRFLLLPLLMAFSALPVGRTCAAAAQPKPNIVFIMADDLGWADLGCTGSTFYETPHLDRLAADGMRFTTAYSACPVCSPTRAAAMTGKYPARVKVTDYIPGDRRGRLNPAFYLHHLPLEEVTIAESLRAAGYKTAIVGKWHLGDEGFWPQDQGFDVNVAGSGKGGSPQISPYKLPNITDGPPGEYLTERLTDEAVKFIDSTRDKPFFLCLTQYDVHTPLVGKKDLIDKFQAKAAALPASNTPRFRAEGAERDRRVQDHAVYAAKVASLDQCVGRVRETLARRGLAENTVIVFTSDNGGLSTTKEAPTSNAPLRAGKGWLYEGGIRVPLVVHWPGVTSAGRTSDVPVITNDFYPTLLEITGQPPLPAQHVDGISLVPLIKDEQRPSRDTLYWHYPHYGNQGGSPGGAMRDGDWKLIEFFEDHRVELYNLRADAGERHNVAALLPERAQQLRGKLAAWRESVAAEMPTPNPDYRPSGPPSNR